MPTTLLKNYRVLPVLLTCLPLLSGCAGLDVGRDMISSLSDSIFGDDDNTDPPAAITEYQAELQFDTLWSEAIGDGADKQYLKLNPTHRNGLVFVASRNGLLQARNVSTGALLWETKTEFSFSAGPGLGLQSVIMGSSRGEVMAFDNGTGEQKWQVNVPSEVLAEPVIAKGVVVIRTTDGKMLGLREDTGATLWMVDRNVPALSLRGAGKPLIIDDTLIAGSANGKLEALQLRDGKTLWEATIAIPTGRSEVERLVDLDADPIESHGTIFISSFQGGTSAVSQADGDVTWRNQDISSYTGINADFRHLYVNDTHSEVSQLDQRSGAALWKQKDLHNRQLTAAVVYENYVVVGDYEGYVHWLSVTDGRLLGHVQVAKAPIEAKPLVVDGTVFIYAKDGTLAAIKAR